MGLPALLTKARALQEQGPEDEYDDGFDTEHMLRSISVASDRSSSALRKLEAAVKAEQYRKAGGELHELLLRMGNLLAAFGVPEAQKDIERLQMHVLRRGNELHTSF
jgi:hypothetical protein